MNLAFITFAGMRDFYVDDRVAVAAFAERGHHVTPVVWDETSIATLNTFDAVVMRTPWDWFKRTFEFQAFLEKLEGLTRPLLNPQAMLTEYYDKRYLLTLEKTGVPIVPTRVLEHDALDRLPQVLSETGWQRAVIKPTVSANSNATHLFTPTHARSVMQKLRDDPQHHTYLVQPYLDEIERDGEWSLMFFGGEFSHAVRKLPKAGDFRVQSGHGGRAEPAIATRSLIEQGKLVVVRGVPTSTYARVDGVVRDGTLLLMELEVIEPELFFRADAEAAGRFADAVISQVANESPPRMRPLP